MRTWRVHLILILLFLFGATIIGRLTFLQIVHHGFYRALAQGQQNISSLEKGERGEVFIQDKNGTRYTLATNQVLPFVFLSPREIKDIKLVTEKLSQILNLEKEFVEERLQNKESFFELLKRRISLEEKNLIEKEDLVGVYIGEENARLYPQNTVASHLIGFVNQDGNGQYGIEEYYNDILEGKEGLKKTARSPAAYILSVFQDTVQNGSDLTLTIDYNIQSMAESLLQKAKDTLEIEGGTIIVMDPISGKILALANAPTFDPNSYFDVKDLDVFQNPALQKLFEPGSMFKPITMASAIEQGEITPDTTYEDKGMLRIGDKIIYNYDKRMWGKRTMTEVLEFSINTGAVFAEQQLGHENFLRYIEKFGITEPTNIDLTGEVYSQNKELQKGYEINFATAAFGQGIEMTPLQIIRAFSAIANNGILVEPFITEHTGHPTNSQKQAISPHTASQVTSMLVNVVENGFAKGAKIPGYYIAGKTGTAQVSWSALGIQKSGYSDRTVQSFMGYAPAFDPRFFILIKLNNPQTKTAEYSAVPIFRELAKYIIDYYQIPPDYQE